MKQHKWHKEIKAWADGAEIESRFKDKVTGWNEWDCMGEILAFSEDDWWEYRIKPEPEERYETIIELPSTPIKEEYLYVYYNYSIADYKMTIDPYFNFKKGIQEYIGKIKLEAENE